MLIIGQPSASYAAIFNAVARFTTNPEPFRSILGAIWDAACDYGIDPVGMAAQAAHETGWGLFPGNVKSAFCNTAGIKTRQAVRDLFPGGIDGDQPLAHAVFPSWQVGAIAQAQHLRAYCQVPFSGLIVDPRYELVRQINMTKPPCVHFTDLNGRWAPAGNYGDRIEALASSLLAGA